MLGKLGRKVVGFSVSWGAFFACTPYKWNWTTDEIYIPDSKFRKIAWIFNIIVSISYETFLVFRLIQTETKAIESTGPERAVIKFWTIAYFLHLASQLGIVLHRKELPASWRRISSWFHQVHDYYAGHEDPRLRGGSKSRLDLVLFLTIAYDIPGVVLWIIPSILLPGQFIYVTSLAPDPENISLIPRVLAVILYAYIINTWYACVYMWLITCIPYAVTIPAVLRIIRKELKINKEKAMNANNDSVSLHDQSDVAAITLYNQIQIINKEFNQVYCSVAVPVMKWTLLVSITYCLLGFLRVSDASRWSLLAVFIGGLGFLEVLFSFYANFYKESSKILALCHQSWRSKLDKRILRQLRPLKVYMAGFYFIDEVSPITMFDYTINTSISLVVAGRIVR